MLKFGKRFGAIMSIENMKKRLNYQGGNQQQRMNEDKLRGLKKALSYSYQAATAVLADGQEYRCLINRNKQSLDLDDKILSIEFDSGVKEGDTIMWKENRTHWLVFLQRLEETAYFRADLRRCRHQITLDNGKKYWIYIRGPVEQSIIWSQASGNYYNKLNYTLIMYLVNNEETLNYFHRFAKVNINGQPWDVQAVDSISTPNILQVALKESFSNLHEDDIDKAVENSVDVDLVDEGNEEPHIYGASTVYPYDTKVYEVRNFSGNGVWKIANASKTNIAKLIVLDENKVEVQILTGRSGEFELVFDSGDESLSLPISIETL